MKKTILSSLLTSHSLSETKQFGFEFAHTLLTLPHLEFARVVVLNGNLGAGKTAFTKGVALGFGIKKTITSPTFVLMRRLSIKSKKYKNLFHLDAYRLSSFSELSPLGFEQILKDPHNIIFIEWPNNIKSPKIKSCGSVSLRHKKENQRLISIKIKK